MDQTRADDSDQLNTVQKSTNHFYFSSNKEVQLQLGIFDLDTTMLLNLVRQITKLDEQILFTYEEEPLSKKLESKIQLSEVIQKGSEQIIVVDNREKIGNNVPIEGSTLVKKIKDLDVFLYPITKNISLNDQNLSKVIMVIGQTGSGKTTLLNSLVNYHMGIEFNDTFRYVVVDEKSGKSQTESQTQEITQYLLRSYKDRPSLIIVDTPGFGDTRGMEQDRLLIDKIKEFFDTQMDQVHAICFVAPSNYVRLTSCQKYIFNEVLKLFGKDIAENFVCMITFSDGNRPPILQAFQSPDSPFMVVMDEIKYTNWYMKFNNSGVFQGLNKDSALSQMTRIHWDLSMESFKQFYTLKIQVLPVKSLKLTKEVLKARECIKIQIIDMNIKNEFLMKCQQSYNDQIINVENNKKQINANQNYDIDVEYPCTIKIQLEQGVYNTNCVLCNHTCHLNCAYPDDSYKRICSAMMHGKCTICKSKCDWTDHKNMAFRFDTQMTKKTERCQEIYKAFMDAKGSLTNTEKIIQGLELELESFKIEFSRIQFDVNNLINVLKGQALQSGVVDSSEDYIDEMIRVHQDQKNQGWEKSIKYLQDQKKYNMLLQEAYQKQSEFKGYGVFLQMKTAQIKNPSGTFLQVEDVIEKPKIEL